MKIILDIAFEEKLWRSYKDCVNLHYLKNVISTTLGMHEIFRNKNISITILFSDDKRLKILNKEFRNQDKSTNVLSFSDKKIDYNNIEKIVWPNDIYLGDIAFSYQNILEETIYYNETFKNHFTHLLVHAILHLLCYDHEDAQDEVIMQNLENKVLSLLSISSPYS
ncbi:MAG: rRNA maturation RNase YbeY [Rickettsiaceae bacterium]|nr:rRNA maturation RNase YbeY [Rickettsiaceae bacterium]